MKKIVFLLLIFFTLSIVHAQDVKLGVKAGISYGKTKTSESDYNKYVDPIIGPQFGVVADIGISEKFSVQPELLYTLAGFKITDYPDYMEYDYKGKLHYLSIPVMAKYNVKDGFYLEAGPYFNYLLSAKETAEYTGNTAILLKGAKETFDVKDDFKSLDLGLAIGACYELENGMYFDARYTMGLMDINNRDLGEKFYPTYQLHNNFIFLTVGIFIHHFIAVNQRIPSK